MARIHLTGATGYIGASVRRRLEDDCHEVEVSDYRLPDPPTRPIDADVLIHLAAAGGGSHHLQRRGNDDPAHVHAVNVTGLAAMLGDLANHATRFMFLSSGAVYAAAPDIPTVEESWPLSPSSAYAASKVESEKILRESGLDFMILRPCGVFGQSVDATFGGAFLNVVVDRALRDGRLTLLGGGQGIDSLYLPDLVEVVARACNGEWQSGATYNVAGDVVTVAEMMDELAQALHRIGRPCEIDRKPWTPPPGVLLDNARLKRDLPGWQPTRLGRSLRELLSARSDCLLS